MRNESINNFVSNFYFLKYKKKYIWDERLLQFVKKLKRK